MEKTITINYLSHNRFNFYELTFHFLSKIKVENRGRVKLNVLATHSNDWEAKCDKLGIEYSVTIINSSNNYLDKIKVAISSNTKYSVKLDEDCFINNYVWDYIIENVGLLDNDDILTLSPTMSNNIPSCDYFINDFIGDESVKNEIRGYFLKRPMPNGLWGVDYTPLNKHTINATEWDSTEFYRGVDLLNTNTKGIHPLRISYEAQVLVNKYIIENVDRFLNKNEFDTFNIDAPYFTNSLFFIKTNDWRNILSQSSDSYDEIALNKYKKENNKKFLFVKNGFGLHPMYNTVFGDKNPWNIGVDGGEKLELEFMEKLKKLIL